MTDTNQETTTMTTTTTTTHTCGGTILTGGNGDQAHIYCDRCAAYTYDTDGTVPDGAHRASNRAAYDAGRDESPSAEATIREMIARVTRSPGVVADGSDGIGIIVRQALADDAAATAEDIAEIVREAQADAAVEAVRS